jgi:hypothetical protein
MNPNYAYLTGYLEMFIRNLGAKIIFNELPGVTLDYSRKEELNKFLEQVIVQAEKSAVEYGVRCSATAPSSEPEL